MVMTIGSEPTTYSTHSLCRRGTTYMAEIGVSREIIMLVGDWKSDAVDQYLHIDLPLKGQAAGQVKQQIIQAESANWPQVVLSSAIAVKYILSQSLTDPRSVVIFTLTIIGWSQVGHSSGAVVKYFLSQSLTSGCWTVLRHQYISVF